LAYLFHGFTKQLQTVLNYLNSLCIATFYSSFCLKRLTNVECVISVCR